MIHKELKKRRLNANLSQEEIADELNVSQSTYARIEGGCQNWGKYLEDICSFFKIQPSILLDNEFDTSDNNIEPNINLIIDYERKIKEKDKIINILEKQVQLLEEKIKGS